MRRVLQGDNSPQTTSLASCLNLTGLSLPPGTQNTNSRLKESLMGPAPSIKSFRLRAKFSAMVAHSMNKYTGQRPGSKITATFTTHHIPLDYKVSSHPQLLFSRRPFFAEMRRLVETSVAPSSVLQHCLMKQQGFTKLSISHL